MYCVRRLLRGPRREATTSDQHAYYRVWLGSAQRLHNCFVEPTVTRFGNLGRVFKEGESELLNGIARLSILYEDLRLEIEELRLLHRRLEELTDGDNFRVVYFVRRALVTLIEFRRVLAAIRKCPEYKRALPSISKLDAEEILPAAQYFQRHGERIKELRNEFGGHVQPAAVEFATKHLSNASGKITVRRSCNGWTLGLECHFAADLVVGAITSKLMSGADAKEELTKAMEIISEGFTQVQAATAALVSAFLWDRFGK